VLKGKILHADFFSVDAASKIRYAIPVHLIGESPAIASKRGIMLTGTQTITVETLPGKLLHGIDVDISGMTEIGSTIVVGDIKMPADVVVIDDPEEMVFRITQTSAQRAEEEIEAGANSSEPEIIQKGKLEDE